MHNDDWTIHIVNIFILIHLITIVPVLVVGPILLFRQKGDSFHTKLGRIWAYVMIGSCLTTFWIRHNGGFSWLHGLALFTIFSVIKAIVSIKNGNISAHKRAMVGSYIGAFVAFIFASTYPDRLISSWFSSMLR